MKEAKALLEKYKAGECTSAELHLIDRWLLEIHMGKRSDLSAADFEQIGEEVFRAVLASRLPAQGKRARLWPRVAGRFAVWKVAAAVAAITLGVWLYYASFLNGRHSGEGRNPALAMENDIAPGKNTATLTLANGEVINLSEAKTGVVIDATDLKYNDGTSLLSSRANAKDLDSSKLGMTKALGMTSVSTPRGGQYQVVLPDGTKVWLNADSKLSFPSQFSGKERKVVLEGEAYFAVVHNEKQPFRVESKGQVVEDIGTEFNISAYADENNIKTTLVEGLASVSSLRGGTTRQSQLLKPNQQAILSNSKIKVVPIDAAEAIAWQKGNFLFEREDIKTVMRKIARWYDIEVVYEGNTDNIIVGGTVSRFSNVSKVLGMLQETGAIKFRIEGRRVYIRR